MAAIRTVGSATLIALGPAAVTVRTLATAHLGEPFLAVTPSGWVPAPPR